MAEPQTSTSRTELTPEERAIIAEGQALSQKMLQANSIGKPGANYIEVEEFQPDEASVTMEIPLTFVLTMDNHKKVRFLKGFRCVPESLARHWYVKAQGCKTHITSRPSMAPPVQVPLLGCQEFKAKQKIGSRQVTSSEITMIAFRESGLTADKWNDELDDDARGLRMLAVVERMAAEAKAAEKTAT